MYFLINMFPRSKEVRCSPTLAIANKTIPSQTLVKPDQLHRQNGLLLPVPEGNLFYRAFRLRKLHADKFSKDATCRLGRSKLCSSSAVAGLGHFSTSDKKRNKKRKSEFVLFTSCSLTCEQWLSHNITREDFREDVSQSDFHNSLCTFSSHNRTK